MAYLSLAPFGFSFDHSDWLSSGFPSSSFAAHSPRYFMGRSRFNPIAPHPYHRRGVTSASSLLDDFFDFGFGSPFASSPFIHHQHPLSYAASRLLADCQPQSLYNNEGSDDKAEGEEPKRLLENKKSKKSSVGASSSSSSSSPSTEEAAPSSASSSSSTKMDVVESKNNSSRQLGEVVKQKTPDATNFQVHFPGLSLEDLKLDLNPKEHILTVSAQKKTEEKKETKYGTRTSVSHISISRVLPIGPETKAEDIKADFVDGVLHVTVAHKALEAPAPSPAIAAAPSTSPSSTSTVTIESPEKMDETSTPAPVDETASAPAPVASPSVESTPASPASVEKEATVEDADLE